MLEKRSGTNLEHYLQKHLVLPGNFANKPKALSYNQQAISYCPATSPRNRKLYRTTKRHIALPDNFAITHNSCSSSLTTSTVPADRIPQPPRNEMCSASVKNLTFLIGPCVDNLKLPVGNALLKAVMTNTNMFTAGISFPHHPICIVSLQITLPTGSKLEAGEANQSSNKNPKIKTPIPLLRRRSLERRLFAEVMLSLSGGILNVSGQHVTKHKGTVSLPHSTRPSTSAGVSPAQASCLC